MSAPRNDALNLGLIHEHIAAAIPEREALVDGDRRFTWAQMAERSRRLANVLRAHGLGCRRERVALANHESGQDHLGLYLWNGAAYLEGMLGAYKARVAPFNVNYRYVESELLYLLRDSAARAFACGVRTSFSTALSRASSRTAMFSYSRRMVPSRHGPLSISSSRPLRALN